MRGKRISRALKVTRGKLDSSLDEPLVRRVRQTLIDFNKLRLPADVTRALADAFWQQWGGGTAIRSIAVRWAFTQVFARFVHEVHPLNSLADLDDALLAHYIEWLNGQVRANGQPWRKGTRSATYTTLRKLLQWIQRCRPGLIDSLHYPSNPFPWRNRDTQHHRRLSPDALRAILDACQQDIAEQRAERERIHREIDATRARAGEEERTLAALLIRIDRDFEGVLPANRELLRRGRVRDRNLLQHFGGASTVGPYLYPHSDSLLPYFLAILIHTAGNPEAIAELHLDCLQPIPLLDDRELVVWAKRRAGAVQRRSFHRRDPFEPPALVRELIDWTSRLRPFAPQHVRERLFVHRAPRGVHALTATTIKHRLSAFCKRHQLPRFSLASVRPSVLTALYRSSGDLRQVKEVANHASISTTVQYVQGPEVDAQHRRNIATLQNAFIGHLTPTSPVSDAPSACSDEPALVPRGRAVTMFGFDCKDPLEGVAPGSRRGELCVQFLGCFTCPNSVIASDAKTIARLLQARDHLRDSATRLHPARWEAIYSPLLRILEDDLLSRFAAREIAAAQTLRAVLPPLPELR